MAKDDTGSLLSKVVKFVRNPATNWSDLDHSELDRDSGHSKQMLKDLVERKKRNDFVRRREFEMLRKLRRRELVGTQSPTQRPSFFQSSLPSKPDERAQTLKKIDEIEAQMSMQWWKTKHKDSSINSSLFPSSNSLPDSLPPVNVPERPMLEPMLDAAPPSAAKGAPAPVAPAAARPARAVVPVPVQSQAVANRASPLGDDPSASGFSASKYFAIEVGEIAHDPELEEAAIRFANGDDQGAEAGLLDALGSSGAPAGNVDIWLALFDLYRATGQQSRFEVAAIDFANQFQRSAPQWFSMPAMVDQLAGLQPAVASSQAAHWSCPPLLGLKAVGVLKDVLARTASPWRLDFTRLSAVEPGALPLLSLLFLDWANQAVELRLIAGDHLDQVLAAGAPSGDRSVAPDWWHARMALLRVMSRMDDFELAALNYCVTYEVSPPSWENPRCICQSVNGDGHAGAGPVTIISAIDSPATGGHDSDQSDFRATTIDSMLLPPAAVELSGTIIGDVSATVEKLDAQFAGAEILSISCFKLVRVDFAAAGTLLNWVSMLHSQGRQVQFSGVHRLIAGFFNVIGISELARVVVRTD